MIRNHKKRVNMNYKKGDLIIYKHNFYFPIILMEDGLHEKENCSSTLSGGILTKYNITYTNGIKARTIGMRQDYIYDNLDQVICNLGQITFEYFYDHYKELIPQYADDIKEEFDRMVLFN